MRQALTERLLAWYVNTSGVAPPDKDARGFPPFLKTPSFGEAAALAAHLDA